MKIRLEITPLTWNLIPFIDNEFDIPGFKRTRYAFLFIKIVIVRT